MRSSKELFEMRDKGMHPCCAPGCRNYGSIASKKFGGVVCAGHAAAL
jgi:hypothetical protein